ncbi:MAG: head-tail adaptor protein [Prevotella sp.]|jgi:head-tail adaptor|nr:head-tail adaptor protein [Prevotella sp.]
MRSESLDKIVDIIKPTVETNEYGEEKTVYGKADTVYASRVKISGRRAEVIGEHFPQYSAAYDVWINTDVEENWRLQEHGGMLYTITNIIPNEDRDLKTLICERVNE